MPFAPQRQPVPRPESMPTPFFDFQNQLREGVEGQAEAKEAIAALLRAGERPKITVLKEFLKDIMERGGLMEKETHIPGFVALIGTLGREAYKTEGRVIFEVINPDVRIEPRFTGKDKKFHGVVYFPKGFIPLKDLHWQSN